MAPPHLLQLQSPQLPSTNNPAPSQSSSNSTSAPTSSASTPVSRLSQLSSHIMGSTATASVFTPAQVAQAPEDPLFGLMRAYRQDDFDKKIDLGIGAYRDNNAKPWILPVVRKADEILHNDPNLDHEYLPISGLANFTSAAQKLILGADSVAIKENRVTSLQTISGTGAVHLGALFLAKFHPRQPRPTVYLSNPTWANHNQIFTNVGLAIDKYPYFSPTTKGLDIDGMLSSLKSAPLGSIVVLHPCAHNPTGVDPTQEQWKQIASVIRERQHFPFFDCAYQGFASGDLARDAWAIRYFIDQGFETCVSQSFAKNFGLYGERAGAFHFVSGPGAEAQRATTNIASQLAILQRSEISNPPAYGSRIASIVLNDPKLYAEWEHDLRTMSGRIIEMRRGLRQRLEAKGTPGTWDHITSQIGMFSFTGLNEKQVQILREKWHVYMTKNGRISMAGLNTHNIDYFAEAVDSTVRETS
ncbi:putative aspartate transaminase [Talaromyces proteolyticus]|uniref:Aspartate aminotransferase n=1 Tax=Talaromyces proteolyticus TaxID=1131652 RepID=A0AAD4Q2G6_9EURO|nr:putative aspartate transaminase [Talaromyces proteolyticus]KAH8703667.1 putative aspartate transaminase [Talaromyces proteolyticus]